MAKAAGVGSALIASAEKSIAKRKATEAIITAQKGNNLQAVKAGIEAGKAVGVGEAILKAAVTFVETGEALQKLNSAMSGQNPDSLRLALEEAKKHPKMKAEKIDAAEKRLHAMMVQVAGHEVT